MFIYDFISCFDDKVMLYHILARFNLQFVNLLHVIILLAWQAWHIQIQRWINLRITKRWVYLWFYKLLFFFCQLHDVFSSSKPVLNFFGGYCTTHQHPKSNHIFCFLRCWQGWWGRGRGSDRKWVRMLVVPFRGQNQWSGTFYGVSNFSWRPET